VDVWAAGVIMWVMLTGILPFFGSDTNELVEQVVRASEFLPCASSQVHIT